MAGTSKNSFKHPEYYYKYFDPMDKGQYAKYPPAPIAPSAPKPPQPEYWNLEYALVFIRDIQKDCRSFGYHVCLGGGVLNNGESKKDLDLYFLPLDNGSDNADDILIEWLSTMWGEHQPIGNGRYADNTSNYLHKIKFHVGDGEKKLRVDAFIM